MSYPVTNDITAIAAKMNINSFRGERYFEISIFLFPLVSIKYLTTSSGFIIKSFIVIKIPCFNPIDSIKSWKIVLNPIFLFSILDNI